MKASKFITPYIKVKSKTQKGKMVKKRIIIPNKVSGVYIIREIQSKKIVYVGKSHTQLQSTIYRHFNRWTRPKNNPGEFGYKSYSQPGKYEVRIITCTPQQADRLETIFITYYKPRDNSEKIASLFYQQDHQTKNTHFEDFKQAEAAIKKPELSFSDIDFDEEVPF